MNQLIMKNSGGKRQRAEVVASPRTASWAPAGAGTGSGPDAAVSAHSAANVSGG